MEEVYRFNRRLVAANALQPLLESIAQEVPHILQTASCRVLLSQPDGGWMCKAAHPVEQSPAPVELPLATRIYRLAAGRFGPA